MARFEVGKSYEPYAPEFVPVKVIRRTEKSIWVTNGDTTWMMRIWFDKYGNECATDSKVPKKWREAFTYQSTYEV